MPDRPITAVVPAYNEGPRVAAVVRPLLASGAFARVLVVDDGSADDTLAAARAAGADAVRPPHNLGKGGAMRFALDAVHPGHDVAFFDADLLGLRPSHAALMVSSFRASGAGVVAALRDYGPWNALQGALEPITGERVVRREVLDRMRPEDWRGFAVEAGMNESCRRLGLPVVLVQLDGLSIVPKWHKGGGAAAGFVSAARMTREVLCAMGNARQRVDLPPAGPIVADCFIPAHDESGRVARVVRTALACGAYRRVVVVDDGSADATAAEAAAAGAEVLRLSPNRGKGGAMLEAFRRTDAPWVQWLDADLVGLRPAHLLGMRAEAETGQYGMVVGADTNGRDPPDPWVALYLLHGINLSGQRLVHRSVLARIPERLWLGYGIEAAMDVACMREGLACRRVLLNGLRNTFQYEKRGVADGYARVAKIQAAAMTAYGKALAEPW
jgi:glycosyltransferase involved in cell wall biosynthesis